MEAHRAEKRRGEYKRGLRDQTRGAIIIQRAETPTMIP